MEEGVVVLTYIFVFLLAWGVTSGIFSYLLFIRR